jgi:hypothetical protein
MPVAVQDVELELVACSVAMARSRRALALSLFSS